MREEDEHEQQGVSIHVGFPNPAADKSLRSLDLNQLLIEHTASTFLFRIRGRDWVEQGIMDGDIAIVDRAPSARPNDLVVWWDETAGEFSISTRKTMPNEGQVWGVITSTIHQFRKVGK
jgi:SOS-response transcriptional repressor LexA